MVIDSSQPSYPSYGDPVIVSSFMDGLFMNAMDKNKIGTMDNNDVGESNASQSKSPSDGIVGTFGESIYTTVSNPVTECLGNWTRVEKQSRKGHAK